jgi:heat shock protein HslJ
MKKCWTLIPIVAAALVLPGCSNSGSTPQQDQPEVVAEEPIAAEPGSPDFDFRSDQVFTDGSWEYRYSVNAPDSRSEGYVGRLYFNGVEVPEPQNINDYYSTPWGEMYWVGNPETLFGNHGWMVRPLDRSPSGRLLPDPGSHAGLASVAGQTWILSRLRIGATDETLPADTEMLPTLAVSDDSMITGFGGINRWSVHYSEPAPGCVEWSEFTTTKMGGSGPEAQLEVAFYQIFLLADHLMIAPDTLEFSSADGSILAVFVPLP